MKKRGGGVCARLGCTKESKRVESGVKQASGDEGRSEMRIRAMRRAIGETAFRALGLAGVTHAGAVVVLSDEAVMTALRVHGVVGSNDGLTILGSGLAGMAQEAMYAEMF